MVVICEKCDTRFRLADDKVTEKGVKVRCSKCQHTFLVKKATAGGEEAHQAASPPAPFPPEQSPPSGPEVPPAPSIDDQALDSAISAALSGIMDDEGTVEATAPKGSAPGETPSPGTPGPGGGELPFSEEQFDFADEPSSPTEEPGTEKGPEGFSFGEGLDFGAEKDEDQALEFKEIEFDSTEEAPSEPERPPVRKEPVFPPAPVEDIPLKKERLTPPKPSVPSVKLKRPKERSPAFRLLLILLISGALLYGAIFTWQHREELLGLGSPGLSGVEGREASSVRITTSINKNYFIPRTIRGQSIFIIEGKATNNYNMSRSFIRLKGLVYNVKGELMMTEEVYAGNVIPEKDLRNLSTQQIKEILNNRFGELGANMDIRPENTVAFMIVFFDLPEEIAEFEVKVSDSQAASQ